MKSEPDVGSIEQRMKVVDKVVQWDGDRKY